VVTMARVGIVCGYDLDADLTAYVESIRPLILREKLDYVVLSGGRTSPASFSSEAWMMAGLLGEFMPLDRVLLEEHAMTTLENLVFGRGLAEHAAGRIDRFVVFCDLVHRRKVGTLARMILGSNAMVYCVEHPVRLRARLFEPISHFLEAVVAKAPWTRRYLRAAVVRLKGVTGAPPRSARPAIVSDGAPPRHPSHRPGKGL
ncbi:MAG: ElyC/SanA/YdcF family protein, partial [Thermoanaerobaculia bacterium]